MDVVRVVKVIGLVRWFWVVWVVEGYESKLEGEGPKSKDMGLRHTASCGW